MNEVLNLYGILMVEQDDKLINPNEQLENHVRFF